MLGRPGSRRGRSWLDLETDNPGAAKKKSSSRSSEQMEMPSPAAPGTGWTFRLPGLGSSFVEKALGPCWAVAGVGVGDIANTGPGCSHGPPYRGLYGEEHSRLVEGGDNPPLLSTQETAAI